MMVDNLDEMLEQSRQQPLVYGIALHPYIVGRPFGCGNCGGRYSTLPVWRQRT
jgi:hypothetical protein